MKPKLVANTSRPDDIWPLWICPAFPAPPQQDLVHHSPDTQIYPQFLQKRAVLSSSAISDTWSQCLLTPLLPPQLPCIGRPPHTESRLWTFNWGSE